jgi:hypothetical protein
LLPQGQWSITTVLSVTGGSSYNFELDISLAPDFISITFAIKSSNSKVGWSFEKEIGQFVDVPNAGVGYPYTGRRVRYISPVAQFMNRGQVFYYRIRQKDNLNNYTSYITGEGIVNT